ncbi:MAG: YbhB/YbcL family Raf kinase inhibitor-like protein [Desulfobaccales bacterium]
MRLHRKKRWLAAAIVLMFMMSPTAQGGNAMELTSAAFQDGGKIPQDYVMPGAGGKNISLPLKWSGAPAGTQSFALALVDPHPVAKNWVHWLVINLPAATSGLEAGASGSKMPSGAVELHNSWGKPGYGGPQPPPGTGDHPYEVTLYALKVAKLDLKAATKLTEFQKALEGKVLGTAKITGYYGR